MAEWPSDQETKCDLKAESATTAEAKNRDGITPAETRPAGDRESKGDRKKNEKNKKGFLDPTGLDHRAIQL